MEKNKKLWLPIIIVLAVLIVAMLALIVGMKVSGSIKASIGTERVAIDTEETGTESYDYTSMDLEDYSVSGSAAGNAGESVEPEADTEIAGGDALNNPDGYILSTSDTIALTEVDLENRTPMELTYARNEIYARHGRVFLSNELNQYFLTKSWYTPNENFEDTSLSSVETANADFILQYQTDNDLSYTVE